MTRKISRRIAWSGVPAFVLSAFLMVSTASAWTPPVGIPAPPWPADLDLARPALPSPWTAETAGWYFISGSGCSDSGRTYGYPGAPRCSFPSSPAAGSKIVVDGTIPGDENLSFSGTSGSPTWVMGFSTSSPPTATGSWGVEGSYKIIDGIAFSSGSRDENLHLGGGNNMIRNLSFVNTYSSSNGAVVAGGGTNNVMYRCSISQSGDWRYSASDIDRHGVKVLSGTNGAWYLDSAFYHIQGDGIQVGDEGNAASAINKVYIGRNRAYENLQSCFWTKNATDVVMSENVCSDITFSPGGDGQGMGGQYDPKYVWFLNNTIYNTKAGIKVSGASSGSGGPWYMIGNRIYAVQSDSCNNYDVGALSFRNSGGATMLFNTVHDVDMFVGVPTGSGITVRNNIFSSKRTAAGCAALDVDVSFAHDYNLFSAAGYDPGSEPNKVTAVPLFVNAAAGNFALQAGSPAVNAANPAEEAAFAAFQARYGFGIKKDFAGTARPQGTRWDIGAFEYPSGGAPVPRIPNPPSDVQVR
ncbi:MAG: hypothetical protein IH577_02230 [Deltaproteobacteria bacterium]|nr:hypothetical protein [Deltaproteobacteria bacterium]